MNLSKLYLSLTGLFFCFLCQNCQPSSTNNTEENAEIEYTFFVAGHTYGSPMNAPSKYGLHPPFIAKIDWLNQQQNLKFGVLTGDVARHADTESWPAVWKDLAELDTKIHIAAGNHNVINRAMFETYVPQSYYAFSENKDLFLILDPNLDHWNISGDQLLFLKNQLKKAAAYRHIFVFFHQLLWWQEGTEWASCQPNSFQSRSDSLNFHTTVLPLFEKIDNQIVMFAGDVGAVSKSAAICYLKKGKISFIASGMGVDERDNFLLVKIRKDDQIDFELVGLNCQNDPHCLGELFDYVIYL